MHPGFDGSRLRAATGPRDAGTLTGMDQQEIEAFWADARVRAGLNPAHALTGPTTSESMPPPAWSFGADPDQADRLLAGGADTAEVARQLGVSEQTYFRWRNQFGGLKAEDAKELKKLRAENQRLKRLLADAELDKDMLREVAKGEF